MCVFLLLSGKARYVPDGAHVRVHQIWMGDRAEDAKAASYSAQDLMIVERDIGRLAKYTFDMGGAGDLLSLALSVPPWEDCTNYRGKNCSSTNLVTTDAVAEVFSPNDRRRHRGRCRPERKAGAGSLRERAVAGETLPAPKPTKTAEAMCRPAASQRRRRSGSASTLKRSAGDHRPSHLSLARS